MGHNQENGLKKNIMMFLNQNNMETTVENIVVVSEDKNIGEINCTSMYQAHTWKIYLEAHGHSCKIIKDGEEQNVPYDIQHPNNY